MGGAEPQGRSFAIPRFVVLLSPPPLASTYPGGAPRQAQACRTYVEQCAG